MTVRRPSITPEELATILDRYAVGSLTVPPEPVGGTANLKLFEPLRSLDEMERLF